MPILLADDHQHVRALGDAELRTLDAGERLEGRAGRPPALRAVAIGGVAELVRDLVLDGAALALSGKGAAWGLRMCHEPLHLGTTGLISARPARPSIADAAAAPRNPGRRAPWAGSGDLQDVPG